MAGRVYTFLTLLPTLLTLACGGSPTSPTDPNPPSAGGAPLTYKVDGASVTATSSERPGKPPASSTLRSRASSG